MKMLQMVVAAAMLLTAVTPAHAAETASGTWSIFADNGKVQFETRYDSPNGRGHNSHTGAINPQRLGIAKALSSTGEHVSFQDVRDAGRFDYDGWMGNGKGDGTFTFTVSDAFFGELHRRGYDADSLEEKMAAADLDLSLAYIDAMDRAGLHADGFNQLISMKALDVTPEYIAQLRSAGIGPVSVSNAVSLRALRVDDAYVRDLASVGFVHLMPSQYVTLKALHVDSAYVKYLQAHGFRNLTVSQVVTMKAERI